MKVFGDSDWLGRPRNKTGSQDEKKARLKRDFGGSEGSPDDTGTPPVEGSANQVTYGVFAVVKIGDTEMPVPVDQLIPNTKEVLPFVNPLHHVQLMLDRGEVVLKVYEINPKDLTSKPTDNATVADVMINAYLAANGLTTPQSPVDVAQLRQDLTTASEKATELEGKLRDMTEAHDAAVTERDTAQEALKKANENLASADSTLTEAQGKIDAAIATQRETATQLQRVLLHLHKQYAMDLDPTQLNDKGDLVTQPDTAALFTQFVSSLQADTSNPQYQALAGMLAAMGGMFQQQPPAPPVPPTP